MSEVFWVIGSRTDAGKTTVTVGLLQALNALGFSTMGFKPVAAVDLFASVDDFENAPYGRSVAIDMEKALQASSAISNGLIDDLLEVANPCRLHFFCWIHVIFMMRTGSSLLGNEKFHCVKNRPDVLSRPDIRSMLEKKGFWSALSSKPPIDFSLAQSHKLFSEEIAASYEFLQQYKPDAFVIEGAASLLPVWQGHPKPDHIVVVNGGMVEIHSGIDERVQLLQNNESVPRASDLHRLGHSIAQKSFQCQLPLVVSAERENAVFSAIKELLLQAGIQK